MVKKFTASQEQLKPDTRFNSILVSKFINCLMYDGKKSVALSAFYRAMDIVKKQLPTFSERKVRHPFQSPSCFALSFS